MPYQCQTCASVQRLPGRCSVCGAEGAAGAAEGYDGPLPSARDRRAAGRAGVFAAPPSAVLRFADIIEAEAERFGSGIAEFDQVLGGGFVAGSLVLLAGEPGIGKSSLALQSAAAVAGEVLYVTGEESVAQVKMRARRMGLSPERVSLVSETNIETAVGHIRTRRPQLAIVDSIQAMTASASDTGYGGVGQIKECAHQLMEVAKSDGITLLVLGHVTKEATIAGPKTLEHLVDAVLLLEGDRHGLYRRLVAAKNRFGATDETGLFEMTERGLVGVAPSSWWSGGEQSPFGRVVTPTLEGSRPLLAEVQALVVPSAFTYPRHTAVGFSQTRLQLLLAVITKYAHGTGLDAILGKSDVYVSLSGGLRIEDPALDAALVAAVASSALETPVRRDATVFGEVGLGGEIRPAPGAHSRQREAAREGFTHCVVGRGGERGTGLVPVGDLAAMLRELGLFERSAPSVS